MKNTFIILALTSSLISFGQLTKKVLFIGNSYTYVNDLPSLIDSLANHANADLIKDQSTPGGYTLNQHSTNTTTLSKISSDNWDYVVIQEQSQYPSFPYSQVQNEVYPYAKILCDSVRAATPCAIPLFFNTWGRRDGDPQWDSINTFEKMNNRLYNSYAYMANINSGKLSPIGIGFRHVYDDLSTPIAHTALYASDGSHPSIYGSYLAACIFYNMIFESSAIGNTYIPNGISLPEAQYLQDVAYHVTYDVDSISTDFTTPIPLFTETTNNLEVVFNNQSSHAFNYVWDFGDGQSSTDEHPTHLYLQSGTYTVTLTATYCNQSVDFSQDVTVSEPTSAAINNTQNQIFSAYYNSNLHRIQIQAYKPNTSVKLYTISGQLITEKKIIDTQGFIEIDTPGVYILQVNNQAVKVCVLN
ncbi:MAG: DUF4886 domain-containing protein [Putridiphycobacter sp.]